VILFHSILNNHLLLVFPLPKSPCHSLCQRAKKGCQKYDIPIVDCESLDENDQPAFPKKVSSSRKNVTRISLFDPTSFLFKTTTFEVEQVKYVIPCQLYVNNSSSESKNSCWSSNHRASIGWFELTHTNFDSTNNKRRLPT